MEEEQFNEILTHLKQGIIDPNFLKLDFFENNIDDYYTIFNRKEDFENENYTIMVKSLHLFFDYLSCDDEGDNFYFLHFKNGKGKTKYIEKENITYFFGKIIILSEEIIGNLHLLEISFGEIVESNESQNFEGIEGFFYENGIIKIITDIKIEIYHNSFILCFGRKQFTDTINVKFFPFENNMLEEFRKEIGKMNKFLFVKNGLFNKESEYENLPDYTYQDLEKYKDDWPNFTKEGFKNNLERFYFTVNELDFYKNIFNNIKDIYFEETGKKLDLKFKKNKLFFEPDFMKNIKNYDIKFDNDLSYIRDSKIYFAGKLAYTNNLITTSTKKVLNNISKLFKKSQALPKNTIIFKTIFEDYGEKMEDLKNFQIYSLNYKLKYSEFTVVFYRVKEKNFPVLNIGKGNILFNAFYDYKIIREIKISTFTFIEIDFSDSILSLNYDSSIDKKNNTYNILKNNHAYFILDPTNKKINICYNKKSGNKCVFKEMIKIRDTLVYETKYYKNFLLKNSDYEKLLNNEIEIYPLSVEFVKNYFNTFKNSEKMNDIKNFVFFYKNNFL